jgi:hypothetical protein
VHSRVSRIATERIRKRHDVKRKTMNGERGGPDFGFRLTPSRRRRRTGCCRPDLEKESCTRFRGVT